MVKTYHQRGRGNSAGRWVIALRPRTSSRRWAWGNVQVSSLLWVRAHSASVAGSASLDRLYSTPYHLFGGDSSAIVSLPCFRFYCDYLIIHAISRLPDRGLAPRPLAIALWTSSLAFICLSSYIVLFIDRVSLPPPFVISFRPGSISLMLSPLYAVAASLLRRCCVSASLLHRLRVRLRPSTSSLTLRLRASLPASLRPLASPRA